jgi:dienelactone hydrolase
MYGEQVIAFYHRTVENALRQMPFDGSTAAAFAEWQDRARAKLRVVLGEMPSPTEPWKTERRTVEETEHYLLERVVYNTRPGLQAPACLFTPRHVRGPAPAMLCLHGHSAGGKDAAMDPASEYRGFARRFAEQGCVVLCPDQIGFGERAIPQGRVTYNVLVHGLNMLGYTLIGVRLWDLVRALDLLESLENVDRQRIGVMGLSLGGEMTMFLAALETRVRAACVSGYLTSHRNTFLAEPHCTCGHLRDLARHFEHVDIAAMIAPRPLFLEAGRNDPAFPHQDAEAIVRELRPVYDLLGKPSTHLGLHVHEGGHEIAATESIPWMLARLVE